jgi:hypothetical protein
MKGLWKWSVSLCGSSVKGTWKVVHLLGSLNVMQRKPLEKGISLHMGPVGEHGKGLIYHGI